MLQSVKVWSFLFTVSRHPTVLLFFILIKIKIFFSQLASVFCLMLVLRWKWVDLFFKFDAFLHYVLRKRLWQLSRVERIFVRWWFFVFKLVKFLPIIKITKFFFLDVAAEPWLICLLKLSQTRWIFLYLRSRNYRFVLRRNVMHSVFDVLLNLKAELIRIKLTALFG